MTGFQTAVTLAEFEANRERNTNVRLKQSHLEKVMEMSKQFTQYLDEAHGVNDATFARDRGLRADHLDDQYDSGARRDENESRSRIGGRRPR